MSYTAYKIVHKQTLVEEVVQEALIKMLLHLDDIDKIKCHKTKAWVVVITRRTAIDKLRVESKHFHESEIILDYMESDQMELEDVAMLELRYEDIKKALKILDDKYSDVLIMKYIFDYTNKDISEMFNISLSTVRKRCERGRKKIKGLIYEKAI